MSIGAVHDARVSLCQQYINTYREACIQPNTDGLDPLCVKPQYGSQCTDRYPDAFGRTYAVAWTNRRSQQLLSVLVLKSVYQLTVAADGYCRT